MLYSLLFGLHEYLSVFNVFRYITFRTFLSILTALLISFLITPYLIKKFNHWKVKCGRREDVPESHERKKDTPTMGGFVILISAIIPTLLWSDLKNSLIWVVVWTLIIFGTIGFIDDLKKLRSENRKGIPGKVKFVLQILAAFALSIYVYKHPDFKTLLSFPFFKTFTPDLGLLYIPFAILVIVGASNSVNLTDGLDGLAIGPTLIVCGTFMLFSYVAGHVKFAEYLQIFYVKGAGELTIVCGAILGAGMGFLWYNAHPADLFMGDTGSLSLGATLGMISILIKQEFVLLIAGGIFVVETLSVIIQVISFKLRRKRVFKMAPIHHHFELKGWSEEKIVVRFWIVSVILALIALSTLKLR